MQTGKSITERNSSPCGHNKVLFFLIYGYIISLICLVIANQMKDVCFFVLDLYDHTDVLDNENINY